MFFLNNLFDAFVSNTIEKTIIEFKIVVIIFNIKIN